MAKVNDTADKNAATGPKLVTAKGQVLMRFLGPPEHGMNAVIGKVVTKDEVVSVTEQQAAQLLRLKQPFEPCYDDDRGRIEAASKHLRDKETDKAKD